MRKELYEICERLLSNEEESKKILSYETLDELYEYFLKKLPGLSKEEFDEFICEALENYAKEQETIENIKGENLENISGGAFNLRTKIASGFLALMSAFPAMAASAVNATKSDIAVKPSLNTENAESVKIKISNAFKKTKEWIKAYPKLTVGIGVTTAALATLAIVWGVRHRNSKKHEGNDKQVGNVAGIAVVPTPKVIIKNDKKEEKEDKKKEEKKEKKEKKEVKNNGATKIVPDLAELNKGRDKLKKAPESKFSWKSISAEAISKQRKNLRKVEQNTTNSKPSGGVSTIEVLRRVIKVQNGTSKEDENELTVALDSAKEAFGSAKGIYDKFGGNPIPQELKELERYEPDVTKAKGDIEKLIDSLSKVKGADWREDDFLISDEMEPKDYNIDDLLSYESLEEKNKPIALYTAMCKYKAYLEQKSNGAKRRIEIKKEDAKIEEEKTKLEEFLNGWGKDHKDADGNDRTAEMLMDVVIDILKHRDKKLLLASEDASQGGLGRTERLLNSQAAGKGKFTCHKKDSEKNAKRKKDFEDLQAKIKTMIREKKLTPEYFTANSGR